MNEEQETSPRPSRSILLPGIKWFGIGVGSLLILLCGMLITGLLWLRTETGEKFLRELALSSLQENGITASFASFEGPLPGTLRVKELTLADTQGTWFSLQEGMFHLYLPDLIRGKLTIAELRLIAPELYRLPESHEPPLPEPESNPLAILQKDNLQSLGKGIRTVLEHVTLEKIQIERLKLGADLTGFPLLLNLTGGGPLTSLHTDFSIESPLFASILPGYETITALPHKEGEKESAEQSPSPTAPLAGTLILGNEGSWLSPLTESGRIPDAATLIEAELCGVPSETEISTASSSEQKLSSASEKERIRLNLLLTLQDAEIAVEAFRLSLPGGEVTGNHLVLQEQLLEGTLTATSRAPAILFSLFAPQDKEKTETASPFPFTEASLQGTLSGKLDEPLLDLQLHLTDIAPANTAVHSAVRPSFDLHASLNLAAQHLLETPSLQASGEISLNPGPLHGAPLPGTAQEQNLPATAKLAEKASDDSGANRPSADAEPLILRLEKLEFSRTADALELQSLHLESRTLDLNGKAHMTDTGQIESEASLTLSGLRDFLASLKPFLPDTLLHQSPLNELDGNLALSLQIKRDKEEEPLRGTAGLSLNAMHWGIQQAQAMLGTTASLDSTFSIQSQSDGATVNVEKLVLTSAKAQGDASLRLAKDGHINADMLLKLTSIAELDAGLSGSATIQATIEGDSATPAVRLQISSPDLGMGTATLKQFHLALETPRLSTDATRGHLLVTGAVEAPSLSHIGGDKSLNLSCNWNFSSTSLAFENVDMKLPGASLDGTLETTLTEQPQLSGVLSLNIRNWAALSALAGTYLQGDPASIHLHANRAQTQKLNLSWNFGKLSADGFTLRRLKGNASVTDPFGRAEISAKAELGSGIIAAGGLAWNRGQIALSGNQKALGLNAALSGRTSLDLKATLYPAEYSLELSSLNLLHKKNRSTSAGIKLTQPTRIGFRRGLSVSSLSLAVTPSGSITVDGNLGSGMNSLKASIEQFSLKLLESFSSTSTPDGLLNGELTLHGPASRPQGNMEIALTKLGYPDSGLAPVSIHLNGLLNGPRLDVEAVMDGLGETPATGRLQLPLRFTAEGLPQPVMNRQITGAFHWSGELAALWQFVPLANTALLGRGSMDAAVSGTLADPQITASLTLIKASFENILAGLLITNINADAELRSHGDSTLTLSAEDGQGGSLTLDGTIGTFSDGFPLQLTGLIHDLAPLHRNDLDINLSGEIAITGKSTAPDIHADLTINKGQYRILQSFGTDIPTLDVVEAGQPLQSATANTSGPTLDVHIAIPNQFFVRGAGLDSEWQGQLGITGAAINPIITGMLTSVRGTFDLLGKQFTLSKGQVSFSGGTPPNPLLDIQVTYQASNITAVAAVGGTASSPVLSFTSQPALPQDEIVAQILFGRSASSLGRMEAIQLATELASLAGFGRGKGGVMGELRESLGFDVLRFGSIQEGGQPKHTSSKAGLLQPAVSNTTGEAESIPALEVGKYITDDIYVGLEQGMSGDSTGVRIEVELTPSLNLQGSTTSQGSEVGINWKKDY